MFNPFKGILIIVNDVILYYYIIFSDWLNSLIAVKETFFKEVSLNEPVH